MAGQNVSFHSQTHQKYIEFEEQVFREVTELKKNRKNPLAKFW
jgi:hypothetical protein